MCVSCLSYTVAGFLQPLSLVQFLKFPNARALNSKGCPFYFCPGYS
uniref:Uncharacterized protein n=1 Tax=Anguilla anguilla TaxID=7936 RepID=A0A0E9UK26_ANGAN